MSRMGVDEFNRSVDHVFFLQKLLDVNDILISEHKSFSDKAKDFVNDIWEKTNSFVGRV